MTEISKTNATCARLALAAAHTNAWVGDARQLPGFPVSAPIPSASKSGTVR